MNRLPLVVILAYLPTILLALTILVLLAAYFLGWRIQVIPIPPVGTPTPPFQAGVT